MHSYSTLAFIISTVPFGERGVLATLYTKDFGLVRARIDGVRSIHSRLRGHIQPFSFGMARMIRSRSWRVATFVSESNAAFSKGKTCVTPILGRISRLIPRLVHGEEKNDCIFETLLYLSQLSLKDQTISPAQLETIAVVRILSALGYVALDPVTAMFIPPVKTEEAFSARSFSIQDLVVRVNQSLAASHL